MSELSQKSPQKSNLSAAKQALLKQRLKGIKSKKLQQDGFGKRPFAEAPLSFSQERFWFLQQLQSNSGLFNMHEAFSLTGVLNVSALERALTHIVARHDVLRATFQEENGQVIQTIQPPTGLTITVTDLSDLTGNEQPQRALELATAAAKRPFNLQTDFLLRLSLLKLNEHHHWLLLTIHHIVADEWSINLIWQELTEAYARFCQNQTPALPSLPIQYPDFAHWQAEQFKAQKMASQLTYWQEKLQGELPSLQMPTDFPRPTQQTFKGAFERIHLSLALKKRLTQLAQANGASLFMILLAAYKLLLYRYTQQTDLLVGTPIANRNRPETKQLVGLFLNTVVMRTHLDPEASFLTLLKDVRQGALDAYANQTYPFEKLVEQLQPSRDISQNPLFQTMFVFQSEGEYGRSLPHLDLERIQIDGGVAKFDTTLFMMDQATGLEAAFEYNTDLFERETICRLLRHWHMLLTSIAADPKAALHSFTMLPDAEWQQVVGDWNDTAVPYAADRLVHQLIETQAAKFPQKTAVKSDGQTVSYQQLNEKANQLAHHLIAQGIQANDIVGLMVDRSIEMAIGIVAILKAGGAYLPLDPAYPDERLQFMRQDAQVKIQLTMADIQSSTIPSIAINGDYSDYPTSQPETAVTPSDLAYIIYTSGSTGRPKGVMVTHQNIVHSTTARFSFYSEPVENFLLLSSFSFDSSMVGIFWSLCQGGTLSLPNQGDEKDVQRLAELIETFKISHILALPSLYNLLLTETEPSQLHSLTTVIVAGEACPKPLVTAHYALLPEVKLYNEYGPTEATVWSTACLIPKTVSSVNVPIGVPIPNMQNIILDPYQHPVPIGVPGELYIGGEGITKGYLNRPELTDSRFVQNLSLQPQGLENQDLGPKISLSSNTYYRTGDLVRWLPDGQIEFLGRIDHQVKIRGFRIELGEIETAVKTFAGVTEAVVLAIGAQQKQLIAYFTAQADQTQTTLRAHLSNQLPEYMVPTFLVQLDALPRTPNGKIDRKALPEPSSAARLERPYVPPTTDIEKQLASIWESVLEQEQVSIEANFFNLGGHSLMATQLISRIFKRYAIRLPVQTIFSAPTIRQMASVVEEAKEKMGRAVSTNGIQPIKRMTRRVRR